MGAGTASRTSWLGADRPSRIRALQARVRIVPRAFVAARGGTLFLDEIGKASRTVQQKLLHAIEYGEIHALGADRETRVDVRLVAATNLPLAELVTDDRFLDDLAARLTPFRVRVPPLRERRADIPLLVARPVARHASAAGYARPPLVDAALLHALQAAPWPHNLRELDAAVHRLLLDADGAAVVTLDHCVDDLAYLRDDIGATLATRAHARHERLTPTRLAHALATTRTITDAARLLGVDRTTVYRFQARERAKHSARSVRARPRQVSPAVRSAPALLSHGGVSVRLAAPVPLAPSRSLHDYADAALVDALRAHHPTACAEFFARFRPLLERAARRMGFRAGSGRRA